MTGIVSHHKTEEGFFQNTNNSLMSPRTLDFSLLAPTHQTHQEYCTSPFRASSPFIPTAHTCRDMQQNQTNSNFFYSLCLDPHVTSPTIAKQKQHMESENIEDGKFEQSCNSIETHFGIINPESQFDLNQQNQLTYRNYQLQQEYAQQNSQLHRQKQQQHSQFLQNKQQQQLQQEVERQPIQSHIEISNAELNSSSSDYLVQQLPQGMNELERGRAHEYLGSCSFTSYTTTTNDSTSTDVNTAHTSNQSIFELGCNAENSFDHDSNSQSISPSSGRTNQKKSKKTSGMDSEKKKSQISPKNEIDKLAERRRRNRESSSRCYYNRKRIIDALDKKISFQKRRYAELYDRALELRHENAKLKRDVVINGIPLPTRKQNNSSLNANGQFDTTTSQAQCLSLHAFPN